MTVMEREAAEHSAKLARLLKDGPQKAKRKRRSPKPPKIAGTYAYESTPVATRKKKGKNRWIGQLGLERPELLLGAGRATDSAENPVESIGDLFRRAEDDAEEQDVGQRFNDDQ